MHYIGVDYHKKYSYIVVKDREGKVKQKRQGEQHKGRFPAVAETLSSE